MIWGEVITCMYISRHYPHSATLDQYPFNNTFEYITHLLTYSYNKTTHGSSRYHPLQDHMTNGSCSVARAFMFKSTSRPFLLENDMTSNVQYILIVETHCGVVTPYGNIDLAALSKIMDCCLLYYLLVVHYSDVIMDTMASQITSLAIVYSTFYSGRDQREHQSSASLAFVQRIHRWPVNSPHKWPVTRKMFPFNDVIMRW